MISVKTNAYVGPDGTLTVAVPTPEELGWPPGFFERTFGSLKDDPMERLSQGEYEVRDSFDCLTEAGAILRKGNKTHGG